MDAAGIVATDRVGGVVMAIFSSRAQQFARRFVKFCLVGGTGVVVNTAVLFALTEWGRVGLAVASPLAVEVAIINNFYWNNSWTFRAQGVNAGRLVKFNLVSLVGMAITTGVLLFLVNTFSLHYLIANLFGIGVAMVWNFLLNFFWTWG
jgi:dolichol-phosphate mannosyltransferase